MADHSAIEWTDATWNPIVGCSIVSPGCTNCYAMRDAWRKHHNPAIQHYRGLTKRVNGNAVWTGKVAPAPDRILTAPLRWKRGRRIFVNSMGDLFHESIPDEWIDRVFAVMALCPQHTFQVLTKRAERMREYMADVEREARWMNAVAACLEADPALMRVCHPILGRREPWLPLPNVWLGVSAERQQEADERIPHLLATPAAVRFVSCEPLLGSIDLIGTFARWQDNRERRSAVRLGDQLINWVIVGGESGPDARPMEAAWAQSLRDQCAAAGISFFFKQWGAWVPEGQMLPDGRKVVLRHDSFEYARPGKKAAGRLLDGVEHNAFPEVRA